jgi:hypothetical protein
MTMTALDQLDILIDPVVKFKYIVQFFMFMSGDVKQLTLYVECDKQW